MEINLAHLPGIPVSDNIRIIMPETSPMKIEQMKREEDVKKEVRKMLERLNAWYYMHVPVGLGRSGIPDFTAILNGRGLEIETKFSIRKVSSAQARELTSAAQAGGISVVVNEYGLDDLYHLLVAVDSGAPLPGVLGYVINYTYKSNGELVHHAALDRST